MSSDSRLARRTILVLRAVAAHRDGIGLSALARHTGIAKATCLRILDVLQEERWVGLDTVTRRYHIALGMLSAVGGLLEQNTAFSQVREAIGQLAAVTEETAGFDMLTPPEVTVLVQAVGPQLIAQSPRPVPRTQPVWSTSTGKVLLAAMPRDRIECDFGPAFDAPGGPGRQRLVTFLDELETVRAQGYAVTVDELEEGASSVAVPVVVNSEVVNAVWVGGPTFRFGRERAVELVAQARRVAEQLGTLLQLSPVSVGVSEVRSDVVDAESRR